MLIKIRKFKIYNNKHRYKDLFFALSHGVKDGKLRNKSLISRKTIS